MMKKVRLGVVGCGGIVQSAHSKAIAAEMENGRLELTATCDIIIERAENAAKLWDAQHVTDNWETMVDHVDAVLVALPHDLHHACGKFFLEHGKHVMMEKPLATTEPDCIDLIETSHRVNKTLMVGYPWRYRESAYFIKDLIDSKKYGELFQCSMWTEQYTKMESSWGNTKKGLGGGQFFSHGCHYIDWLLWMLGEPEYGIHFGNRLGTPWMEGEGTSQAMIQFKSGVLAYHGGTWGARGTKLAYGFHFHFTEGMVEYDHHSGKMYLHTKLADHIPGEEGSNQKTELIYECVSGKNVVPEMAWFLDCILEGKKPLTTPEESLQGLRVIWRMYEAERDKKIANLSGLGLENDWKAVAPVENQCWEEWA